MVRSSQAPGSVVLSGDLPRALTPAEEEALRAQMEGCLRRLLRLPEELPGSMIERARGLFG